MKKSSKAEDGALIDLDVALVLTEDQQLVITGTDLLGRLLRGMDSRVHARG